MPPYYTRPYRGLRLRFGLLRTEFFVAVGAAARISFSRRLTYTVRMTTTVRAHFGGRQSLVLDRPVDLPIATPLRMHVEPLSDEATLPAEPSAAKVTPAPRKWQPLDIQIDPELSHAIALDPEFDVEEA